MNDVGAQELGALVASVAAAVESGVLLALVDGPVEPHVLAARTGTDPVALERVLAVLVAADLLVRDGDRVALESAVRADGEVAPGGLPGLARLFGNVPAFLRHGARVAKMDGAARERADAYAPTVGDLGRLFAEPAKDLAQSLPPPRRVLDVGAGSGVWSLAMLEAAPLAHATALDLEPVLPSFLARAARLGLAERVGTLAGDFHEAALPAAAFDRVVLANVLHLETATRAARLIERTAVALAPGGELVVVDVFPVGPGGVLGHAAYELHLAMRTGAGRAHAEEAIAAWCRSAGLAPGRARSLAGSVRGLGTIVARREA